MHLWPSVGVMFGKNYNAELFSEITWVNWVIKGEMISQEICDLSLKITWSATERSESIEIFF